MYTIKLTPEQVASIRLSKMTNEERAEASSSEAVYELIKHYANEERESFIMLVLDGANHVKSIQTISVGTLTSSLVHPREVFRPAIEQGAASIIVAHNHPSGNLYPSTADTQVTERLQECGELLGIKLLDHLIITKKSYKSIA